MARKSHVLHFGKLVLSRPDHLVFDPRRWKADALWSALNSGQYVEEDRFRYIFTDLQALESRYLYFTGFLVKYKSGFTGELIDEDSRQVVEGELPKTVVAKSPFFLEVESSIVAYRPIPGRISDRQFREQFARLIEAAYIQAPLDLSFSSARIDPIYRELRVLEAVAELATIYSVKLKLRPTNPTNREPYRKIDERLKELRAIYEKQEVAGGPEGLNRDALEEDEIYAGILMAEDGYGTARIEGLDQQGRPTTITTTEAPEAVRVADPQPDRRTLQVIEDWFVRLRERG